MNPCWEKCKLCSHYRKHGSSSKNWSYNYHKIQQSHLWVLQHSFCTSHSSQNVKQLKHPLTDEWTRNKWSVHTMESHPVLWKEEIGLPWRFCGWDSAPSARGAGFRQDTRSQCMHAEFLQSCLTLRDPCTGAPRAPQSMGLSWQEHWNVR